MEPKFQSLYDDALHLLRDLCTQDGILASSIEADNYRRVWARDSIVCGLAGLLIKDATIINGLKNSLLTLAAHQHDSGMIPSNVLPNGGVTSYGSLVGRIDTNTWFLVGACLYFQETSDEEVWTKLKPALLKCRAFLKASEFNGKGWIYTPLSGNWADEYPIHGYTLYDNMLRIWGEKIWREITGESSIKLDSIIDKTLLNFWPGTHDDESYGYQSHLYELAKSHIPLHFGAFILPGKYDLRFDAAANGLALYNFSINVDQKSKLTKYIDELTSEISKPLIPAFWPPITSASEDWNLLESNYSFEFKNNPGAFHNGGIWPVWMGLFCLGLAKNEMKSQAKKIVQAFTETVSSNPEWDFQEYLNAIELKWQGKSKMGYTASGIVFMKLALQD